MKTEELMRRTGKLCAEHGYRGAARIIGTSEGTIRRVFVYGVESPALRRAAAIHFGEADSWSSNRVRLFADLGNDERKQILLEIMTEMGFETVSQLLRAIADGQVVLQGTGNHHFNSEGVATH